ncbi:MAG: serine/threonine protein kinase [Deltaproteobacteria bacterium]|nr:serine/threonine protein kinase [Deltaproteobacteria bacterium]
MTALAFDPGTRIGRYRVVDKIGRGGMGGVFEVEDESGARFALKSPIADVGGGGDVTRRFAREANALRMLDHANLVAAVDVFVEAGQLFLVMEKVTGVTLAKALQGGAFEPRRALVLARQLLEGVGHAHQQGLVHRDLKPDNIILVDMGGWDRVKIIDFGLVKLLGDVAAAFGAGALTRTGLVFGTPAYIAPEQALGRVVDGRADLYAIGVILFEMLAGRPPFRDDDPVTLMRLHAKAPPPRLDELLGRPAWCTSQVLALVGGALIKDPSSRFASTTAMTAALDEAFQSLDAVS